MRYQGRPLRRRRLSLLIKKNRRLTLAQLTAQYNTSPCRIASEQAVQLTLLDIRLRWKRRTHVPLLTKHHRHLHLHYTLKSRD